MRLCHLIVVLAPLLVAGALAHADEARKPKAAPLPGVTGDYSIVALAPEPVDQPQDSATSVKAGNWDVTVSGYVWVQVGASSNGDGR